VAVVSPEEAARLGKDLTPVGAEKAGYKDGTIPDWTGGLAAPPSGFKPGDAYALQTRYPTMRVDVYPTRRPVHYPE